jgi:undecaprenyl-diphosphatase
MSDEVPMPFACRTGVWIAVAALCLFAALAVLVRTGGGSAFDGEVLRAMRVADTGAPAGPVWLPSAARDFTALGSAAILVPLNLFACAWLVLRREPLAAGALVVSGLGANLITTTLKYAFDRARPDAVAHLVKVVSPSFPSGHATASSAAYLAIALLLVRPGAPVAQRRLLAVAAVLATLVVGFSRVYLGVHYPTDVVAGWAAGVAWTLLCVSAAHHLAGRTLRGAGAGGVGIRPGET